MLAEHTEEIGGFSTGAPSGGSIGLGELLRGAREARGLTLQQISAETKIPQRHLEALEHDNLGNSPGGFYQRAEVRAYARAVSLDQHLALAQLQSALGTSPGHKIEAEPPAPRGFSRSRKIGLIVAGLVVAAIALGRAVGGRERTAYDGAGNGAGSVVGSGAPGSSPVLRPSNSETVQPVAAGGLEQEVPGLPPGTVSVPTIATEAEIAALNDPLISSDTELLVLTQPPGASVTVNGVGWGTAPVTIRYLPPGEKRIRVSRDGYPAAERLVTVTSGRPATVEIELNNQP